MTVTAVGVFTSPTITAISVCQYSSRNDHYVIWGTWGDVAPYAIEQHAAMVCEWHGAQAVASTTEQPLFTDPVWTRKDWEAVTVTIGEACQALTGRSKASVFSIVQACRDINYSTGSPRKWGDVVTGSIRDVWSQAMSVATAMAGIRERIKRG